MEEPQADKPDKPVSKVLNRIGDRAEMGAKYQASLEAVLAIPIGVGLGYLADKQFDSGPVGLFIGLGVGFGAFILRVIRMRPEADEAGGATHPPTTTSHRIQKTARVY